MIGFLGSFLARVGLSFLGDLLLTWDSTRRQAAANAAEQAGANKQVIRDTADSTATERGIAQAEADADKTQGGIMDAAKKGRF